MEWSVEEERERGGKGVEMGVRWLFAGLGENVVANVWDSVVGKHCFGR